ncbi:hypothetical protein AB1286_22835 [Trinickia sp. NRRL B-1857]|uniref:hypothetical protein n=1 Tax=Trinickia sp. NRRL B-1857 TaxID=3162879 RepID=UPI003D2752C0
MSSPGYVCAGRLARCGDCRHRNPDRATIERAVAGLVVLGSGYGASVADSRLCLLHDQFVSPDDVCPAFEALRKDGDIDERVR